ncbi:MAG: hypothetical protein K1V84_01255 [Muribaculaceae bacterium]
MNKYIANTAISISVTLPNGNSTRVSFSPLSNGTSVFYTSDNDIQWALEHHYKFGKLFRLVDETPKVKIPVPKKISAKPPTKNASPKASKKTTSEQADKPIDTPTPTSNIVEYTSNESDIDPTSENDNEDGEATEYTEVTVSDVDAAKDYLAEHFEVVRTKLKTEDIITKTALSFGIIFKYL